jgi:hypothetical protein
VSGAFDRASFEPHALAADRHPQVGIVLDEVMIPATKRAVRRRNQHSKISAAIPSQINRELRSEILAASNNTN